MSQETAKADAASIGLMMVLTFGTGVLDAATYLGLHAVFTANMTGNVVFLGLGLAGAADLPVVRAAAALLGFVLGATGAGLLQRKRATMPNTDAVATLLILMSAAIMGACAVALATIDLSAGGLDVVTGALGGCMGAQAVAARRVAVADVSTVVVTSTLAGLFAEAVWSGGTASRGATGRRAGAVVAMICGAIVGGLVLNAGVASAVALPAALSLSVGAVMLWRIQSRRRLHQWTQRPTAG